ncbi:MAG: hypothetical protein ACSW8A_02540 [Lachnospiraceae bacterium]
MIEHKLLRMLILMTSVTLLTGCSYGSSMINALLNRQDAYQQEGAAQEYGPMPAQGDAAASGQAADHDAKHSDSDLIPLSGLADTTDSICDLDIYKDTLMVLSQDTTETDGSGASPYKLALYSASDGSLQAERKLSDISGSLYLESDFTEDGSIRLLCMDNASAWLLDADLNLIDQTEGQASGETDGESGRETDSGSDDVSSDISDQYQELMDRNPFITGAYTLYPSAALYYNIPDSGSPLMAVTYYDDPEHLYLIENNPEPVIDSFGDLLLCCDDQIHGDMITVDLRNYKESLHMNSKQIPIPKGTDYASINYTCLSEDYALLCMTGADDQSLISTVYLWKYKEAVMNRNLETTCVTVDSLKTLIDDKAAELTGRYGINFYYGDRIKDHPLYKYLSSQSLSSRDLIRIPGHEALSDLTYDESMLLEPDFLQVYYILINLDVYLKEFPLGFAGELYSDYAGGNEPGHLDIFIVKEIPGEASSFTVNTSLSDLEGLFLTAFASDEFYSYQIPLEFMHLMDRRIENWLASQGRNYTDEWCSFNPDGFVYSIDNEEMNASCFCSAASLTSAEDDRSELFASLYEARNDEDYPYWLPKDTPLKGKARYLCDVIRKAFPSLNNQKSLKWEKWAAES